MRERVRRTGFALLTVAAFVAGCKGSGDSLEEDMARGKAYRDAKAAFESTHAVPVTITSVKIVRHTLPNGATPPYALVSFRNDGQKPVGEVRVNIRVTGNSGAEPDMNKDVSIFSSQDDELPPVAPRQTFTPPEGKGEMVLADEGSETFTAEADVTYAGEQYTENPQ